MLDKYSAVDSLQQEVDRFFKTNEFSPMTVTNFFAQARVVLRYVEDLETALQALVDRHTSASGPAEDAKHLLKYRR